MEKELDLTELLKDAPKGTKLYSPICGECKIIKVHTDSIVVESADHLRTMFNMNGTFQEGGECLLFPSKENRDWLTFKIEVNTFKVGDHVKHKKTEVVCVLTSKSQNREGFWAKRIICSLGDCEVYISEHELGSFEKVEKLDPKWLKPFDRVLMRSNGTDSRWVATFFSHTREEDGERLNIAVDGYNYSECIPYNEETKHLVGTADEEPTFYKID